MFIIVSSVTCLVYTDNISIVLQRCTLFEALPVFVVCGTFEDNYEHVYNNCDVENTIECTYVVQENYKSSGKINELFTRNLYFCHTKEIK